MPSLTELKADIPLAGALALYFYFKPSISTELSCFFFGAWITCFVLDAKITVDSKLINHEKNLIFPILYHKFGSKLSTIIQFVIEITVIILIASAFEGQLNQPSISVVSLVFGLAHLEAYLSNIKTIKKILKD